MAGDISTEMTAGAVPEKNRKRSVASKFAKALEKKVGKKGMANAAPGAPLPPKKAAPGMPMPASY